MMRCTVLIDGAPARSCVTLLSSATGKAITTIESLAENGDHPLQVAWQEEHVSQCGYCQPGQIMNMVFGLTAALKAQAVANAIFAATGKRARRLPIRAEDLK